MQLSIWKSMRGGGKRELGGALRSTRTFLSRHLWVWPAIAAVLLPIIGWWVHESLERAICKQMSDQLTTILNADVTSLRTWMKQQESSAQILAANQAILPLTRELLRLESESDNLDKALRASKALGELRAHFAPRMKILDYTDFFLISPNHHVLAAVQEETVGRKVTGYRREFFAHVLEGKALVSRPYRSIVMIADEKGGLKAGLPTMLAAAAIRDETGRPIAVLGLRIRPDGAFTEILQVARSGESGETYAFDKDGLLLSQSRFDDELKKIGLLADQPDAKSILTVELRDPQVNMADGERPTLRRQEQPLTRMAAEAVLGKHGVDVKGYRNYRGVPVIGAWTWLTEYDMGIASEIDVDEAYQPLHVLRLAFGVLMTLLVVGALAIFVFTIVVARQEVVVQEAVLAAKQLGQYTLEEKIGAGGMGAVYRAKHALLQRPTAIKLIEPDKVSEIAIARFEREVQLTAQLNHPNTIAIYDFGHTPEGVFYYAMEYLEGINLEDLVARFGPQPEGRVAAIIRQVCGSLTEAHAKGLIHRDIKPANIILTHRGGIADFVKVLDFGLALAMDADKESRLTAADTKTGTPLYMAPEAIEFPESVNERADMYAVGAVMYYLLTGTPVFSGKSLVEICMKHVQAVPEPPSHRLGKPIAPRLEAIVLQCLAKEPGDRPASVVLLDAELHECGDLAWSADDAERWWRDFKSERASASATLKPRSKELAATVMFDAKKHENPDEQLAKTREQKA